MNKTAIFITFACLAALGIAGALILQLHRPDATATFTTFVGTVLGLVTLAAGTFYGLGKTNEKIDAVQKQTNGNLTRERDENRRLIELLIAHGINPSKRESKE